MGKSRFGSIRKRSSGRYEAYYRHLGEVHRAPKTFVNFADARAFLAVVEADIYRGTWIDPTAGRMTVGEFATKWIDERVNLRPRTSELDRRLLQHQIIPQLGKINLADLSASQVRSWNATLAREYPSTASKAYRLLSTMMRTAVEDGVIGQSPCRIKGAGNEKAAERPVASVEDVLRISDLMPERMRALVLLVAWTGLRRGEAFALERRDIDLIHGSVKVERAANHLTDGRVYIGPPKTAAGIRTVHFPSDLRPILERHLDQFVGPEQTSLVFAGEHGGVLRPHVLYKHYTRATNAIGKPELRFHDLRHTSATWAAVVGGTTRELMNRLGHSSPNAALRYQHATVERDRSIAEGLGRLWDVGRKSDTASEDPA